MMERHDTCRTFQRHGEAYAIGTLSAWRRRRFAAHLEACPACRAALDKLREGLAVLDALEAQPPPEGLAARTLARIDAAAHEAAELRRPWYRGQPWLATVSVAVVLCLAGFMVLPALQRAREAARRSSVENNLKQLGLVFKMYANESPGEHYPPLAPYAGVWVPDLRVLYPDYITDLSILTDPRHPEDSLEQLEEALHGDPPDWERAMRIMAQTYAYLGWTFQDEAELEEAQRLLLAERNLHKDLHIEGRDTTAYRLREGIERFLITDINNPAASATAQSTLPILITRTPEGRGARRGIHVLYMDGHVAFLQLDESFPASQRTLELLAPPPEKE